MGRNSFDAQQVEVVVKFLERTKNGDFAPIEESSLNYARLNEKDESQNTKEQQYYYAMY
mgnify:CR=1 FL=1